MHSFVIASAPNWKIHEPDAVSARDEQKRWIMAAGATNKAEYSMRSCCACVMTNRNGFGDISRTPPPGTQTGPDSCRPGSRALDSEHRRAMTLLPQCYPNYKPVHQRFPTVVSNVKCCTNPHPDGNKEPRPHSQSP